jgi:hypothetical protein
MLDRFEALAARLGSVHAETLGVVELADLRVAANVIDLRAARGRLGNELRRDVDRVLSELAVRPYAVGEEPPASLRTLLDAALARCGASREPEAAEAGLALVGLRQVLFPDPPPAFRLAGAEAAA